MPPQVILIEKLIDYIEIDRNRYNSLPLSEKEKSELKEGLCHGFAIVYSYMLATNREHYHWWKELLNTIINWDSKEESLQQKIRLLSSSQPEESSLDTLLQRAVNYVLFHQVPMFIHPNQFELLTPNFGLFDSEKGKIKDRFIFSGCFTSKNFSDFLEETLFTEGTMCLIHTLDHVCSLWYEKDEAQWYFYDPNLGETISENKEMIVKKVFMMARQYNGIYEENTALAIDFSTIREFSSVKKERQFSAYSNLITQRGELLLKNFGLHYIVNYSPKELAVILTLAKRDSELRKEIGNSLTKEINFFRTGFDMLNQDSENIFSIFSLAVDDEFLRWKLLEALTYRRKDGLTRLQVFLNTHELNGANALLKLVQESGDIYFQRNIFFSLHEKDKLGYTLLNVIARMSPGLERNFIDIIGDTGTKWEKFYCEIPFIKIETFMDVIKLAESNQIDEKDFSNFLTQSKVHRDLNGFELIVFSSVFEPEMLNSLFEIAKKNSVIGMALLNAIIYSEDNTLFALNTLASQKKMDVWIGFLNTLEESELKSIIDKISNAKSVYRPPEEEKKTIQEVLNAVQAVFSEKMKKNKVFSLISNSVFSSFGVEEPKIISQKDSLQ